MAKRLILIVSALLAIILTNMLTSAQGGNQDCPAGTTLIAKFNFNGSSYIYETGLASDAIIITNASATGGMWQVGSVSYLVSAIVVKGGNDSVVINVVPSALSGTFDNSSLPTVGSGNIPAISNIQFCGSPTPQPTPTNTPVTPTATPVTPTATPVTPTATPVTPTATPVTPTATPVTPTATPVTPTATPVTPTATPVTPTATPVTPTATPVTPTATPVTPTATPVTPTPDPGGNPTLKFDPDAQSLWYLETPTLHLEIRNNTGQGSIVVNNLVCEHVAGVEIISIQSASYFTSQVISGNTITFSGLQAPNAAPNVLPAGQNLDVFYVIRIQNAPRTATLTCTLNVQGFAPVVAQFRLEVRTPEQQQPGNGQTTFVTSADVQFQEGDQVTPYVSQWWDKQYLNAIVTNTGTTGIGGFDMVCSITGDDTGTVKFDQVHTNGAFASVTSLTGWTSVLLQNATSFTQGGNRNVTLVIGGLNNLRTVDADRRVSVVCSLNSTLDTNGPDFITIAPTFG